MFSAFLLEKADFNKNLREFDGVLKLFNNSKRN